jgi:hypothetical protein
MRPRCPFCKSLRLEAGPKTEEKFQSTCKKCNKTFYYSKPKKRFVYTSTLEGPPSNILKNKAGLSVTSLDDTDLIEALPGECLYGVKNNVTREYKHIYAKDREDAIKKLKWEGQVIWTHFLSGAAKEKKKEESDPVPSIVPIDTLVKKDSKGSTLKQEIGSIDNTLPKQQILAKIVTIVKSRRAAENKPISDEHLTKLSTYYYHRFTKKKGK